MSQAWRFWKVLRMVQQALLAVLAKKCGEGHDEVQVKADKEVPFLRRSAEKATKKFR